MTITCEFITAAIDQNLLAYLLHHSYYTRRSMQVGDVKNGDTFHCHPLYTDTSQPPAFSHVQTIVLCNLLSHIYPLSFKTTFLGHIFTFLLLMNILCTVVV